MRPRLPPWAAPGNFKPSHLPLPWALDGKSAVKAALASGHKKKDLGDRLDCWVRRSQSNQTIGIPIGPDTSFVLGDLVLQHCASAAGGNAGETPGAPNRESSAEVDQRASSWKKSSSGMSSIVWPFARRSAALRALALLLAGAELPCVLEADDQDARVLCHAGGGRGPALSHDLPGLGTGHRSERSGEGHLATVERMCGIGVRIGRRQQARARPGGMAAFP